MSARAIGYTVTHTWCRKCAPEGLKESSPPLVEGDDAGVPYSCDDCGEELRACDHEWSEWHAAYDGEIRFCEKNACGEADYR